MANAELTGKPGSREEESSQARAVSGFFFTPAGSDLFCGCRLGGPSSIIYRYRTTSGFAESPVIVVGNRQTWSPSLLVK